MSNKMKLLIASHGAGKSEYLYNYFLEECHKDNGNSLDFLNLNKKLLLVVPEQDTAQKQKIMMQKMKDFGSGIVNVDVVSFDRLAYYVFEKLEIDINNDKMVLDDAKVLILRLAINNILKKDKNALPYFNKIKDKIGFLQKLMKCMSEFYSYNIDEEKIKNVINELDKKPNTDQIKTKLKELSMIEEEFKKLLKFYGFNIKEDKLNKLNELLQDRADDIKIFDDVIIAFDGFTGFTPIQLSILKNIYKKAKEVFVCIDYRKDDFIKVYNDYKNNSKNSNYENDKYDLFNLSKIFLYDLTYAIRELENDEKFLFEKDDILLINEGNCIKYENKYDLKMIEDILFDYDKISNIKADNKIKLENIEFHKSKDVKTEAEFAVQKVLELTRTKNYQYDDIKIIVPELNDYNHILKQKFEEHNIPIHIDIEHNIYSTPIVKALRAAIEVVLYNFSYNSVMKFINCGLFNNNRLHYIFDKSLRNYGFKNITNYLDKNEAKDFNITDNNIFNTIWGRVNYNKNKNADKNYLYKDEIEENIFEEKKENVYQILNYIIKPLKKFHFKITNNKLFYKDEKHTVKEYLNFISELIEDANLKYYHEKSKMNLKKLSENTNESILMQELDLMEKDKKVLDTIINTFNTIYSNKTTAENEDIINEKVDLQTFKDLLNNSIESCCIKQIPLRIDQIVVGDLMHSRFDNPKVVLFLGMNDSKVPMKNSDDNIIDDEMRELFFNSDYVLSQTTTETTLNSRFYTYLALTNPTDKLILSWTLKNAEGTVDDKSVVIKDIEKMFYYLVCKNKNDADEFKEFLRNIENEVKIDNFNIYDNKYLNQFLSRHIFETRKTYKMDEDELKDLKNNNIGKKQLLNAIKTRIAVDNINQNENNYKKFSKDYLANKNYKNDDNLSEDIQKVIFDKEMKFSASRLETYAGCPYKYFLQYTIGLRNDDKFEINAMDIGNLYHKCLENIYIKNDITKLAKDDIKKLVDETINEQISREYIVENEEGKKVKKQYNDYKFESNLGKFIIKRVKDVLTTSLTIIAGQESKPDIFSNLSTEQKFEYKINDGTEEHSIAGKIDKIDYLNKNENTYIKIVDYKSSEKKFSIELAKDGIMIQALLYLDYCITQYKNLIETKEVKERLIEKGENIDAFSIDNDKIIPFAAFYRPIFDKIDLCKIDKANFKDEIEPEKNANNYKVSGIINTDCFKKTNDGAEQVKFDTQIISGYNSNKNPNWLTKEKYDALIKEIQDKTNENIKSIYEGSIKIKPYKNKKYSCKYCKYKSICKKDLFILPSDEVDTDYNTENTESANNDTN